MTFAIVDSSSGAASASATKDAITSGVAGRNSMPPTNDSSGCSRNLRRVATPKFPPPPRIAQNRSGCVSSSVYRRSPSAVTTSAASRSSIVSPCLRTRKPTPPPSVIPPMPTDPVSPKPGGQAVPRRRARVLAGSQTRLGPGGAPLGVDLEPLHVGQVDHDPALGRAVAGHAVAAASHGELQPVLAGVRDRSCDVVGVRDLDDRGRPAVDVAVEDGARLVVVGMAGLDHAALELVGESGGGGEHGPRVPRGRAGTSTACLRVAVRLPVRSGYSGQ